MVNLVHLLKKQIVMGDFSDYASLCVGLTSLIESDIKRICNTEHYHLALICVGKASEVSFT